MQWQSFTHIMWHVNYLLWFMQQERNLVIYYCDVVPWSLCSITSLTRHHTLFSVKRNKTFMYLTIVIFQYVSQINMHYLSWWQNLSFLFKNWYGLSIFVFVTCTIAAYKNTNIPQVSEIICSAIFYRIESTFVARLLTFTQFDDSLCILITCLYFTIKEDCWILDPVNNEQPWFMVCCGVNHWKRNLECLIRQYIC